MKKTYITTMPNHIGAFLKASQCISALGINMTRVSYNKAIDSHTLFIDVEGSEEKLKQADAELAKIGYLQNNKEGSSVVLLEFKLEDIPGKATDILALINDYSLNISYISSQESGDDYRILKMGLYVDDEAKIERFIEDAKKLCKVKLIDYNAAEKIYDNSIFYDTYVQGLAQTIDITDEIKQRLLVNVNLAMQNLDEKGLSPHKTFDAISQFADMIADSKGEGFAPRISEHKLTEKSSLVIIEPDCGSNTMILKSEDEVLFIDTGYACYEKEMLKIIKEYVPNFDSIKKRVLLTHSDLDHCGLLGLFDEIILSKKSARDLANEFEGKDTTRETNYMHKPYINICKILTLYKPVDPQKFVTPWEEKELSEPMTQIGFFEFGDMQFEVYEGKGGHVVGEIVLIDYKHNIAFTGDVYINLKEMTAKQTEYNRYAPILMTGVDSDVSLARAERLAVLGRLGVGDWKIFGSHGYKKNYSVKLE